MGDLHAHAGSPRCDALVEALLESARRADVVLLAGDLTNSGTPAQAAHVAGVCRRLRVPVVAVLGNHDRDARSGITAELEGAGVKVLQGHGVKLDVRGVRVGLAGTTGSFSGFAGSGLEDLGHAQVERAHERSAAHAAALDAGLEAIAGCDVRIALLHYSPTTDTLEGERRELWGYLGSERLAEPIRRHRPDAVLHAHAHAGRFRGRVGDVPVYNVSAEVLRGRVCLLEVAGTAPGRGS